MKKTFQLFEDNLRPDRQVEKIRHEIKKYITRERKKKLPENSDFWDFDCKIGDKSENAIAISIDDISKKITEFVDAEKGSFYIEILAKPGIRPKK